MGKLAKWNSTLRGAIVGAIAGVLVVPLFSGLAVGNAQPSNIRDCDDNAVIRCGTLNPDELYTKYRENQGGNVHAIFAHFGIANERALDGMVDGRVTKSGDVYAGDKRVATGAVTVGRQNMPGSTPIMDGQAYKRAPNVSFRRDSLDAYVKVDANGRFQYAVLKSCGNPVSATPIEKPAPAPQPKPQPKPQPTPQPSPPPVKHPGFEISKNVRNLDPTDWLKDVPAKRGDRLEYRVLIRNTGETTLEEVMFSDTMPAGIVFSNDSVRVAGRTIRGNPATADINLGSIAVGREIAVTYLAVVSDAAEACGGDRLKNEAIVKPKGLSEKRDYASVEVCVPKVQAEVTPVVQPAKQVVESKELPEELPKTGGFGDLAAIFSAFTVGGAAARYVFIATRRY